VTSRLHPTLLLVLAAVALPVAGCGKDKEGKPIPAAQATEIEKQLDSIDGRYDFGDGACPQIDNENYPAIQRQIDSLPAGVDSDVRDALVKSMDRLRELTADCDEQKHQKTTPTETETTPTPTETQPTQTQTQPTETQKQTQPEKPGKGPKKPKPPTGGGGTGVQGGGGTGEDKGKGKD
jgi:hypothetical protein